LHTAIDFTSAGNHQAGKDNQYEKVINAIGNILEPYQDKKLFPTYGIGGVPKHMK